MRWTARIEPNFRLHTLKLNIAFENFTAQHKLTWKRNHKKSPNLALYIVLKLLEKWESKNNYEDLAYALGYFLIIM